MSKRTLIDHLNRLGELAARNVPNLNQGGCCVFASAVADELRKVVRTKIRVSDDCGEAGSITMVRNDMRICNAARNTALDWNRFDLYFAHVFVEFELNGEPLFYDSNGVTAKSRYDPTFGYTVAKGALTNKEAREISSTSRGWNHMFDHNKYAKRIREIVHDYFTKHIHTGDFAL